MLKFDKYGIANTKQDLLQLIESLKFINFTLQRLAMTQEEAIEILNMCIYSNLEAYFIESSLENGHMIKLEGYEHPLTTYNAAVSRIKTLTDKK